MDAVISLSTDLCSRVRSEFQKLIECNLFWIRIRVKRVTSSRTFAGCTLSRVFLRFSCPLRTLRSPFSVPFPPSSVLVYHSPRSLPSPPPSYKQSFRLPGHFERSHARNELRDRPAAQQQNIHNRRKHFSCWCRKQRILESVNDARAPATFSVNNKRRECWDARAACKREM